MARPIWNNPWLRVTLVLIIAGIFYASWPLGYWLNPSGARGLASNLGALNQPYNWLFITLDIISGLLIVGAMWWLLKVVRRRHHRNQLWLETAVIGLGVFGLLTLLDAVLPLQCIDTSGQCLPPLEDPYFVVHGMVSIGSVAALCLSVIALWWLIRRDHRARRLSRFVIDLLLVVWIGFGVGTAVLVARDRSTTPTQHLFILFCSFCVIIIPYYLRQLLRNKNKKLGKVALTKPKVRTHNGKHQDSK